MKIGRGCALLVIGPLAAALLAGCGSQEPSDQPTRASVTAETTAAKQADSGELARNGKWEGRDQGERRPGCGRATCAEAKGVAEREGDRGPPVESAPNVPSLPEETSPGKDEPRPAPDETDTITGPEPDKPTVPAEQPEYSAAEVACETAAETPEEKADCFDD
jgi:hypothetical protein